MNQNTHITVILDRTGSMESIRDDVIGGFNAFLGAQQAQPHPASLTLVQFDSQDPYEVLHAMEPIAEVGPLDRERYVPRASTPLYDAMGRGILELELALSRQTDVARPRKVLFVVVTDGEENASTQFDRPRVTRLMEAKKKLGWEFVFLSADLAAFDDARQLGVHDDSRLLFAKSAEGSARAWKSVSDKAADFRSGAAPNLRFDDVDRKAQESAR